MLVTTKTRIEAGIDKFAKRENSFEAFDSQVESFL